jgi:hypothetical protein
MGVIHARTQTRRDAAHASSHFRRIFRTGTQSARIYQILFDSPIILPFHIIEATLVAGIAGAALGLATFSDDETDLCSGNGRFKSSGRCTLSKLFTTSVFSMSMAPGMSLRE